MYRLHIILDIYVFKIGQIRFSERLMSLLLQDGT
jgi:hypothetical protein